MTKDIGKNDKVIKCSRCDIEMKYLGTKDFHEGTRWGILGNSGELFVNQDSLDMYGCPNCGVVEFFVDKVGEEFRPH